MFLQWWQCSRSTRHTASVTVMTFDGQRTGILQQMLSWWETKYLQLTVWLTCRHSTSHEIGCSKMLLGVGPICVLLGRNRGAGESECCWTTALGGGNMAESHRVPCVRTGKGLIWFWERDEDTEVGWEVNWDTICMGGESHLSWNASNSSHWHSGTTTNKVNCLVLNTIDFVPFWVLGWR